MKITLYVVCSAFNNESQGQLETSIGKSFIYTQSFKEIRTTGYFQDWTCIYFHECSIQIYMSGNAEANTYAI